MNFTGNTMSHRVGVPQVLYIEQIFPPHDGAVVDVIDVLGHEWTIAEKVEQIRVDHEHDHIHWRQSGNRKLC